MTLVYHSFLVLFLSGCGALTESQPAAENNTTAAQITEKTSTPAAAENVKPASTVTEMAGKGSRHFAGAFSNGMKGDSIFFDVSEDGKKVKNLTFKGYWRCSGKLEQTTVGPDGAFDLIADKVDQHISEPPNGGSTAWRFDLKADIKGSEASGTFRMNINNLGCDTYLLKFTARSK